METWEIDVTVPWRAEWRQVRSRRSQRKLKRDVVSTKSESLEPTQAATPSATATTASSPSVRPGLHDDLSFLPPVFGSQPELWRRLGELLPRDLSFSGFEVTVDRTFINLSPPRRSWSSRSAPGRLQAEPEAPDSDSQLSSEAQPGGTRSREWCEGCRGASSVSEDVKLQVEYEDDAAAEKQEEEGEEEEEDEEEEVEDQESEDEEVAETLQDHEQKDSEEAGREESEVDGKACKAEEEHKKEGIAAQGHNEDHVIGHGAVERKPDAPKLAPDSPQQGACAPKVQSLCAVRRSSWPAGRPRPKRKDACAKPTSEAKELRAPPRPRAWRPGGPSRADLDRKSLRDLAQLIAKQRATEAASAAAAVAAASLCWRPWAAQGTEPRT